MSYYVVNRHGKKESVAYDKITSRIQELCDAYPRINTKVGIYKTNNNIIDHPMMALAMTSAGLMNCSSMGVD